jgi:clan AA aspartic protease (TIGR02281 family)
MYQSVWTIASYYWLGIFLLTSMTACNSAKNVAQLPPHTPPPVSQPATPTPTVPASPAPIQPNYGEVYQQALNRADAANAIGQSATSKDDWSLVAHNLAESVQMLKSIEPNSAQHILAAKVLPKYEQQLDSAKRKAVNFVSKSAQPAVTSTQAAVLPQRESFSIPILKKLSGVPVVEVTMDGQKVPMLLDTGASHTLITQSVANRLKVEVEGSSQSETANGTATFDVGTIDRIKFGTAEVRDIRVAIGQDDLPYGLLGHDVYDGYDITFKENSIEFRKR